MAKTTRARAPLRRPYAGICRRETGERIAAAGAAHAVGIRGAPLQARAHAFAGQVSRATVRRAQAGQHAGQEGAVFLQDFVGRDVGRGQAALGDGELRARKARRHLGHGRIALAAMSAISRSSPGSHSVARARGASLRIGIGDPFDPQRLAGALGARARPRPRSFVEAASARWPNSASTRRALTGWLRWRAPRVPRPGPGDARSR